MIDNPTKRPEIEIDDPFKTGLYVSVRFDSDSVARLTELTDSAQIPNPVPAQKLHATVVYSRAPIFWRPMHEIGHVARPVGWEVWAPRDLVHGSHCLVLRLESVFLRTRFDLAMNRGASYDFPDYNPHVTLSYGVPADFDPSTLPVPDFEIIIDKEIAEPLTA